MCPSGPSCHVMLSIFRGSETPCPLCYGVFLPQRLFSALLGFCMCFAGREGSCRFDKNRDLCLLSCALPDPGHTALQGPFLQQGCPARAAEIRMGYLLFGTLQSGNEGLLI